MKRLPYSLVCSAESSTRLRSHDSMLLLSSVCHAWPTEIFPQIGAGQDSSDDNLKRRYNSKYLISRLTAQFPLREMLASTSRALVNFDGPVTKSFYFILLSGILRISRTHLVLSKFQSRNRNRLGNTPVHWHSKHRRSSESRTAL